MLSCSRAQQGFRRRTDICNVLCTCDANRGCSGEFVYGGEPPLSLPGGLEKAIDLQQRIQSSRALLGMKGSTPSTFRRCTPTVTVNARSQSRLCRCPSRRGVDGLHALTSELCGAR